MPRKDRTFTHQDVIRIFENNLDDSEKIKVLVYFLLYLLGFERNLEVLKKVYRDSSQVNLNDLGKALLEVIELFILNKRVRRSIRWLFDRLEVLFERLEGTSEQIFYSRRRRFLKKTQLEA